MNTYCILSKSELAIPIESLDLQVRKGLTTQKEKTGFCLEGIEVSSRREK